MGILDRKRTGRSRKKKTVKEKIDTLADKILFEAIKDDPEVLRAYILKRDGIDIQTEAERWIHRLEEQIRLNVYQSAAEEVVRDPDVLEAFRDKCVNELLGLPPDSPRGKSKYPRPNFQNRLESVTRIINQADEIKKRLGVSDNSWSKVLLDPEVIKAILDVVKPLIASVTSPPQTIPAENNERIVGVEVNGEIVNMKYGDYLIYKQQRELKALQANPTLPAEGNQDGKTSGVADRAASTLPYAAPSSTNSEPS